MKHLVFTIKLGYGTIVVATTLLTFILGLYAALDATGTTDGQVQAIFETPERFNEFLDVTIDAGKKYLEDS